MTAASLARVGDASAQAEYLEHFRADSIVADCEVVRKEMLGLKKEKRLDTMRIHAHTHTDARVCAHRRLREREREREADSLTFTQTHARTVARRVLFEQNR